jgi:uncharacterized protein (TIGR04255 family)
VTDTHAVYPNAPLALVVVEVRFPSAPVARVMPMPAQKAFRDLLGDEWVIESMKMHSVELQFGAQGAGQQRVQEQVVPRFTIRDRTLAVAATDTTLTVETTSYQHYPQFREVLARGLAAAEKVLQPEGVARIGMRYIDEIRVPGSAAASSWRDWIDTSLLPPRVDAMAGAGFEATAWEGLSQYAVGLDKKLVLRYGFRNGPVVPFTGHLRRPSQPPAGPLFSLDFDCFWEPTGIPEFEPEQLLVTCDELRAPARTLFDALVTDRLRNEVFMKEPSDARA